MRKFDTKVQYLKYKILREVTKHAFAGNLMDCYTDIPGVIVKGDESTMRCCVYKERAIVTERIKLALGGDKSNPNVIEVIDIACDECPVSGYNVLHDLCRGCIAHRCEDVCMKGAIDFDKDQKAVINKDKCVECGRCSTVCPYGAIVNRKRPCERACKVNAIHMGKSKCAEIDNDKCISCGACVYQCPFGAVMDKSFILDVIEMIKNKDKNGDKLYAVVAPSISSQFSYAYSANTKLLLPLQKPVGFSVFPVHLRSLAYPRRWRKNLPMLRCNAAKSTGFAKWPFIPLSAESRSSSTKASAESANISTVLASGRFMASFFASICYNRTRIKKCIIFAHCWKGVCYGPYFFLFCRCPAGAHHRRLGARLPF